MNKFNQLLHEASLVIKTGLIIIPAFLCYLTYDLIAPSQKKVQTISIKKTIKNDDPLLFTQNIENFCKQNNIEITYIKIEKEAISMEAICNFSHAIKIIEIFEKNKKHITSCKIIRNHHESTIQLSIKSSTI